MIEEKCKEAFEDIVSIVKEHSIPHYYIGETLVVNDDNEIRQFRPLK